MDSLLTKIREDLKKVAQGKRGAADYSNEFALMTALYYDLDDALHAGASQSEVWGVLKAHGLNITKTRFSQNLVKLKAVFPPRERGVKIDAGQLDAMAREIQALASGAMKTHGHGRKKVGREPLTKAYEAPLVERVERCAAAVELLSTGKADMQSIGADLRKHLGDGWSVKVAVQFAGGTRFGDWAQANPGQGGRFQRVHALAKLALERGLPEAESLPGLFVKLASSKLWRNR